MEDAHPSEQLGSTSQTPKPLHHPCLQKGKARKSLGFGFAFAFSLFGEISNRISAMIKM